MKQKKTIVIVGIAIVLGLTALGGISTKYLKPAQTSAQQSQTDIFSTINQKARENKANATLSQSKEIAGLLIEGLSILEIPTYLQSSVTEQVANAHLNGMGGLDENNIVSAINNLADQASAPNYAYTNVEQVKVVRTFLNRAIPDVVASSGNMTDLEAFAIFTATLSQKVDNPAFMVTSAEFTVSLGNPNNDPLPGTTNAAALVLEEEPESMKTAEMYGVIGDYINSKNMVSSNDIVSMIGIY